MKLLSCLKAIERFSNCDYVHEARRPGDGIMFSYHPFVGYQTCEHIILKMNELILTQIGTDGSRGEDMKRSTLGVSVSKFKVTHCQNR